VWRGLYRTVGQKETKFRYFVWYLWYGMLSATYYISNITVGDITVLCMLADSTSEEELWCNGLFIVCRRCWGLSEDEKTKLA